MVKVIKAWISDPDHNYWDGISLLEKYGSNLQLIYMLRRGKTLGNEERLVYELDKLVASEQEEGSGETQVPAEVDPSSPTRPNLESPIAPAGNPDPEAKEPAKRNSDLLQGLLDQRAAKYGERNAISDTLADLDGEELKAAADRVQKVDDEIIALTTQIQFVEQKGHLPVPVIDLAEDLETFKKKKKSLGEKLSRIKKDLKNTPGNLKKEAQVVEITSQIEALDLTIKALTQTA